MRDPGESLFYGAAGALAAILLGAALTPLRGLTPASNLAFAFMAVTIIVAELGGGGAALSTAITSALSLDFFLTQPYLRLSIEDKHDLIAFVGLAVCGLIAAALGSQRAARLATLAEVARNRELLRSVLRDWDPSSPLGPQLASLLRRLSKAFPLAAAVVRDDQDRVLAETHAADALRAVPRVLLDPETLAPAAGASAAIWDLALPAEGGRVALGVGPQPIGWLDVWGNGGPAGAEARRGLSDAARLLGLLVVGGRRGETDAQA